ncbi:MAG: HEPN domain-containing protein [Nitrososphaeria archaeon]
MSFEEAELLRERAENFLANAEELSVRGNYDLAAFNVEQYCQLILKYYLLVKVDTYPRTYSLMNLLRDLSTLKTSLKDYLIIYGLSC